MLVAIAQAFPLSLRKIRETVSFRASYRAVGALVEDVRMSRMIKFLAAAVVAAGMMAAGPQAAQAQHHHHGGWHHGGGWGYGSGFALGFGLGAAPYYGGAYYGGPYYGGGGCGWVRERFIFRGYWRVRRVWRCW